MSRRRVALTIALLVGGGILGLVAARGNDLSPILPSANDVLQTAPAQQPVLPPLGSTLIPAATSANPLPTAGTIPGVIMPQGVGVPAMPLAPGQNPFTAPTTAQPVAGANPFLTVVTPATAAPSANPFSMPSATPAPVTVPAVPQVAQSTPVAPAAPAATTASGQPAPAAGNRPDETALRYYASQHDLERVGAEIRRLQDLDPTYQPPADLFAPVASTVNEQPLWDLYAAGQYADERAKIAELKAANPTWTPSADLIAKLDAAESSATMKAAYTAQNWQQVVAVAGQNSPMLVCSQIDNLWMLGEALAKLRNYAQAFEDYKYILSNCPDPTQRLATVQKAALLLPQQGIDGLVALGRPVGDGTSEFDSIAFEPLRTALNKVINDDIDAAPIDPNALARFASYAGLAHSGDDMGLLGWYYYSQEQWDAARAWFATALSVKQDPKFIEGTILAMRGDSRDTEALKVAQKYRSASPGLKTQYIELTAAVLTDPENTVNPLSDDEMRQFRGVVTQAESALGAQAIGYTYLNDDDLKQAKTWFDTSMKWGETEGGVIGEAVVASRQKQYSTLSSLKTKYGKKYPGLADFKVYSSSSTTTKKKTSTAKSSAACSSDVKKMGLLAIFTCGAKK